MIAHQIIGHLFIVSIVTTIANAVSLMWSLKSFEEKCYTKNQ